MEDVSDPFSCVVVQARCLPETVWRSKRYTAASTAVRRNLQRKRTSRRFPMGIGPLRCRVAQVRRFLRCSLSGRQPQIPGVGVARATGGALRTRVARPRATPVRETRFPDSAPGVANIALAGLAGVPAVPVDATRGVGNACAATRTESLKTGTDAVLALPVATTVGIRATRVGREALLATLDFRGLALLLFLLPGLSALRPMERKCSYRCDECRDTPA